MAWLPGFVRWFKKTAAPGVGDDINEGYEVTDIWVDETNDKTYICVDNAVGAAVWKQVDVGSGLSIVDTSGTPVDNDYAKFTDADTIEGRSYDQVLSDLSGQADAAFSMNDKNITNLANAIEIKDATNLEDILNNIGITLSYWLMPSSLLSEELTISSAYEEDEVTTTPQTLSIEFKSILLETPTPFTVVDGSIILTHFQARVASVSGTKSVTLHTELYYMDSGGSLNPVQIGADSDETAILTETPTIYTMHLHVPTETVVPLDKRLWLKFVATTIGGNNNPTVWVYNGILEGHIVIPAAGTVLGRFILKREFSQDSGVLVGTGDGTFIEEVGATLRNSINSDFLVQQVFS